MSRADEIDVKTFMKQKQSNTKIPKIKQNTKYLSTREYATLLGKHPVTIIKWLLDGRIEGAIKVGREWRIPVEG